MSWNWEKEGGYKKKNPTKVGLITDFYFLENSFFISSTSTFLMTGLAFNCLIFKVLAFCACLFLLNFLFKVVTAMISSI